MISARSLGLAVAGMSGGQELILCPWHDDRTPSAWYDPKKGLFYCATCHLGLNAKQVADRLGVEIDLDADFEREPEDYNFMAEVESFDLGREEYNDYFRDRNISKETIQIYGVRWKELEPKAAILPITNLKEEVTGVCYRYTTSAYIAIGGRYKIFGKTQPLWPMHRLNLLGRGENLLITEGAWSAMRIHSWAYTAGFDVKAFALLGAKVNEKIVETIAPFNAFFLYDNDEAGKTACKRMRKMAPLAHCWTVTTSPDDMADWQLNKMFEALGEHL